MTAQIIRLYPADLEGKPEAVLQQAIDNGCRTVVILGYDANNREYFASSTNDHKEILLLLERLKKQLLDY